ncbi:MAG: hypothetical protein U1G08_17845 [Verrucomicrobiota bacterium]
MSEAVEALIILTARYGPKFVLGLIELAHKPKPTREEWAAPFKEAEQMDYDQSIREAEARAAGKPLPPAGV